MNKAMNPEVMMGALGEVLKDVKSDLQDAAAVSEDRLRQHIAAEVDSARSEVASLKTDLEIKGALSVNIENAVDNLIDRFSDLDEKTSAAITEQRVSTKALLDDRLSALDGSELMKSVLVNQQRTDVQALRLYLSDLNRKTERVSSSGVPSKHLVKSLEST